MSGPATIKFSPSSLLQHRRSKDNSINTEPDMYALSPSSPIEKNEVHLIITDDPSQAIQPDERNKENNNANHSNSSDEHDNANNPDNSSNSGNTLQHELKITIPTTIPNTKFPALSTLTSPRITSPRPQLSTTPSLFGKIPRTFKARKCEKIRHSIGIDEKIFKQILKSAAKAAEAEAEAEAEANNSKPKFQELMHKNIDHGLEKIFAAQAIALLHGTENQKLASLELTPNQLPLLSETDPETCAQTIQKIHNASPKAAANTIKAIAFSDTLTKEKKQQLSAQLYDKNLKQEARLLNHSIDARLEMHLDATAHFASANQKRIKARGNLTRQKLRLKKIKSDLEKRENAIGINSQTNKKISQLNSTYWYIAASEIIKHLEQNKEKIIQANIAKDRERYNNFIEEQKFIDKNKDVLHYEEKNANLVSPAEKKLIDDYLCESGALKTAIENLSIDALRENNPFNAPDSTRAAGSLVDLIQKEKPLANQHNLMRQVHHLKQQRELLKDRYITPKNKKLLTTDEIQYNKDIDYYLKQINLNIEIKEKALIEATESVAEATEDLQKYNTGSESWDTSSTQVLQRLSPETQESMLTLAETITDSDDEKSIESTYLVQGSTLPLNTGVGIEDSQSYDYLLLSADINDVITAIDNKIQLLESGDYAESDKLVEQLEHNPLAVIHDAIHTVDDSELTEQGIQQQTTIQDAKFTAISREIEKSDSASVIEEIVKLFSEQAYTEALLNTGPIFSGDPTLQMHFAELQKHIASLKDASLATNRLASIADMAIFNRHLQGIYRAQLSIQYYLSSRYINFNVDPEKFIPEFHFNNIAQMIPQQAIDPTINRQHVSHDHTDYYTPETTQTQIIATLNNMNQLFDHWIAGGINEQGLFQGLSGNAKDYSAALDYSGDAVLTTLALTQANPHGQVTRKTDVLRDKDERPVMLNPNEWRELVKELNTTADTAKHGFTARIVEYSENSFDIIYNKPAEEAVRYMIKEIYNKKSFFKHDTGRNIIVLSDLSGNKENKEEEENSLKNPETKISLKA